MPDRLTIHLYGIGEIGEAQARHFATAICGDISAYITEHESEYQDWIATHNKPEGVKS